MRRIIFFATSVLILLLASPLSGFGVRSASAIEAKWTPAEQGDGEGGGSGPLPLSQNQRNQLVQLDNAIANSPDPQATLVEVAEQNGMKPEELADLLMRNRKDMQMAGGGGGGGGYGSMLRTTLPRRVLGAFGGLLVGLVKTAKTHPRQFSMAAAAATVLFYVVLTAPRTGVIISSGSTPFLSSGYTTLLAPPAAFIHAYLQSSKLLRLESSLPDGVKPGKITKKLEDRLAKKEKKGRTKEGVTIEELGRKSDLAFSITAKKIVGVESLLPDYEDIESDSQFEALNDAIDAAHVAGVSIISSRRFAEFVDGPRLVRFYPGDKSHGSRKQQQSAVLVAKSMGDFGLFGIQPLRVAFEEEATNVETVTFHTLAGGHFDGEVRFSIERKGGVATADTDKGVVSEIKEEGGVVVSVSIVVPKRGRLLNRRLAERIVSSLAESIQMSVLTQAKQMLARRSLSNRYRGRASGRAAKKRHIQYETEKKLEEMAEDRRRKWQRGNPDAGRYRPSGHRMRSPNNC